MEVGVFDFERRCPASHFYRLAMPPDLRGQFNKHIAHRFECGQVLMAERTPKRRAS
jgi:hypothetical protein